jgi:hypothetical protein
MGEGVKSLNEWCGSWRSSFVATKENFLQWFFLVFQVLVEILTKYYSSGYEATVWRIQF